ncbi:mitochondrial resolvase Ydc2 [Aspergillus multicolor]|uniref:uncharacterized protein n=1 Tax=Aspergillus multicolor TaxID=41759 RepID=UPI003CCD6EFC
MRLTLRLLGRSKSKSSSQVLDHYASSTSRFPWLSTLKTKQLQHLAQRTGLPSSGTKAVLLEELETGLELYREQDGRGVASSNRTPKADRRKGGAKEEDEGLRVLSIDMGIRNLAFAVLNVRGFGPDSFPGTLAEMLEEGKSKSASKRRAGRDKVEVGLEAWRRVSLPLDRGFSVEEFARYLDTSIFPTSSSASSSTAESAGVETDDTPSSTAKPAKTKAKAKAEKAPFSLPVYATHAHSVISALLAKYNPTHVLIERQRFRSSGGSAVQEWSLRVGVFEGMLWAVLHSFKMQQLQEESTRRIGPEVIAIEPARVGRFWGPAATSSASASASASDADPASDDGTAKKKRTSSSREGKKLKIDLVGSWLEKGVFSYPAPSNSETVRPWVDAYMAKWKKTPKSRAKSKTKAEAKSSDSDLGVADIDITKLDDMADCLVQGVTWLEWEGMKGRAVRDGIGGVLVGVDVPA